MFLFNESSGGKGSFSCLCEAPQFCRDPGWYPVLLQSALARRAAHPRAFTFEERGSQAIQGYTKRLWLLPRAMGDVVGAGVTQLSSCFCWKHFENMKKIVGADRRSDLCPATSLSFFFFFFSNSGLHLPALVLSMPECFQFHAWLPAYLSTAESMFFSVKGMHMFACLLEPGTISVGKKNNCCWITGRHFFLKIVLLVDNSWGSLRWMRGSVMCFHLPQPVHFF